MPRPGLRVCSKKKVKVKLPGGGTAVHYKREKPKPAKCAICGAQLGGVPRL
ncbi:MAG: 50S ribosomal protein L34e, partial [Thermoprotei archaeon]